MKFSLSVEIKCSNCWGADIKTADDSADDPVFVCTKCGNALGPKSSIEARLDGKAYTPLNAVFVLKDYRSG